ncbi:MAG: hypothetical protein A2070_00905 [Bdellovibrionales bacterium GWC1_52_8]|nr:MAG: hypothetical protein A2Z97_11405 [Bdellovibrionales bacterium GWB1_52_6]OFZ03861.1 MAG: hypothetical protein A2X97_15795 [Bdellovibrionales bacterium GWA1_52_35]OFZ33745.1 MAG: hypothetical protein A2070_00905 [Bdellovibrionales bacterium GWC1_52_8]HCM39704.1 hypothetical protein [Bdellovibrionales bacterium]
MTEKEWVIFAEDFPELSELPELEALWRTALGELGFKSIPEVEFFRQMRGQLCLNARLFEKILGANLIEKMQTQWKIERFLVQADSKPEDLRIRSLALGICQQVIVMRMPTHTDAQMAVWLADLSAAPSWTRSHLRKLLQIQKVRNTISHCWDVYRRTEPEAFENSSNNNPQEYFSEWKGLPVCAGLILGEIEIVDKSNEQDRILLFRRARPESVEFFEGARAVLFAEGGVLSHACSIARERGIPCITGLGLDCFMRIQEITSQGTLTVEVDAGRGIAKSISR